MYGVSVALAGLLGAASGCSSGSATTALIETSPVPDGSRAEIPGDWDDVEAAVIIGAERAEMALVSTDDQDPERLAFDLVTVGGEPVRLTAARAGEGRIALEARVGRFGDPARERRLLSAVAARLRALFGRDYAPVRR